MTYTGRFSPGKEFLIGSVARERVGLYCAELVPPADMDCAHILRSRND